MRLLLVLCAFACFCSSSAHAQEATDAQRLNAAPFAAKPFRDTLHLTPLPYGVLRYGRVAFVPTYSLRRTAESWRVPESGQNMTQQEASLKGYLIDHPFMNFGVSAFMRSGRHADVIDSHDPAALAARLGHEPSNKQVKLHFSYSF